jgi:hypothetical protein
MKLRSWILATALLAGSSVAAGSALRGRLLDGDGRPVPGIRMRLFCLRYLGLYETDTDRDGRFAFENVRPTTYALRAKPEQPVSWTTTYYPGVVDRLQASPIAIPAGSELDGYKFRLAASPEFRIRGTVLDDTGAPVPQARVALQAEGSPGNEAVADADAQGRFEFSAVAPGWWRCTAKSGGEMPQRGFADMEVDHGDVDDLEVRVSSPFAVGLSAEREESKISKTASGSIFLNSLDDSGEMVGAAGGSSGDRRRFERVFPGRYKVSMGDAEAGYYLAAVTLGDRDVLGREFALAPGSPDIHAIFRSRPGGVRGTVDGGKPATAVLLPRDESLRDLEEISQTPCQADGRFETGGLRPDEYYAWAFERFDVEALRDPALVRALIPNAVLVRVDRGATATVALAITPWPE